MLNLDRGHYQSPWTGLFGTFCILSGNGREETMICIRGRFEALPTSCFAFWLVWVEWTSGGTASQVPPLQWRSCQLWLVCHLLRIPQNFSFNFIWRIQFQVPIEILYELMCKLQMIKPRRASARTSHFMDHFLIFFHPCSEATMLDFSTMPC